MDNGLSLQQIQAATVAVSFEYDIADTRGVEHYFNGFLVKWGAHTVLIAAKGLAESAAACGPHGSLLASASNPGGELTDVEVDLHLPTVSGSSFAAPTLVAFNVTEMLADHPEIVPMRIPWPPALESDTELAILPMGAPCDPFDYARALSHPLQHDAGSPVVRKVGGTAGKFVLAGIATGSGNFTRWADVERLIETAARASKLST